MMPEQQYTFIHPSDHQPYHTDRASAEFLLDAKRRDTVAYEAAFARGRATGRIVNGVAPRQEQTAAVRETTVPGDISGYPLAPEQVRELNRLAEPGLRHLAERMRDREVVSPYDTERPQPFVVVKGTAYAVSERVFENLDRNYRAAHEADADPHAHPDAVGYAWSNYDGSVKAVQETGHPLPAQGQTSDRVIVVDAAAEHDRSGVTLMTGERVRAVFNVEPREAIERGLVRTEEMFGAKLYRGTNTSVQGQTGARATVDVGAATNPQTQRAAYVPITRQAAVPSPWD